MNKKGRPVMKCANCGNELTPGARFCTSCGCKVEAGPSGEVLQTDTQQQTIDAQPQTRPIPSGSPNPGPVRPATKENRYTPVGESGSTRSGVILIIIYAALGVLGILISIGRTFFSLSSVPGTPEINNLMISSSLIPALVNFVMLLISLIPVILVLLIRRKYLWKIKTKDVVLISLYSVLMWIVSFIQGIVVNRYISLLGAETLGASSIAEQILALAGLTTIMSGLALSLFILARTGARIAAVIFGAASAFIALCYALLLFIEPEQMVRLFNTSAALIGLSVPMIKIGGICQFFSTISLLTMAAGYGFAPVKTKRWIPVFIIIFFGKIILGTAIVVVGIQLGYFRLAAYSCIHIANAVIMIVCALIMLFGATRKAKE